MTLTTCRAALLTAGLLTAASAHAQAFDTVRLQGDPTRSELRLGAVAFAGYKYLGSDERRYLAVPTIDYRSASGWFAGVGNGIGFRFGNDPRWQYGLRVTADLGRREHRSAALRGLGSIPERPEAGVFFNAQLLPDVSLSTSLRYGSGDARKGLVADVGVHYGIQLAPRWRLGTSLSTTYVNQHYMQEYFGITAQQAAASGYGVYSVGAGLRDVRAGVAIVYFVNRQWAVTAGLSAGALLGDAKDSPIVRESAPLSGILGMSYTY